MWLPILRRIRPNLTVTFFHFTSGSSDICGTAFSSCLTTYIGKAKIHNMSSIDLSYALEHTDILYVPDRRIDTFGDTKFYFHIVSELMDEVGTCRIRSGWVEASRPRILRPADLIDVGMEGFSEDAKRFIESMSTMEAPFAFLFKYGFRLGRSEVAEELVHEDIRQVSERLTQEALASGNPFRSVISGVDDTWELSLLCFIVEMIRQSYEINAFDFKRRGML